MEVRAYFRRWLLAVVTLPLLLVFGGPASAQVDPFLDMGLSRAQMVCPSANNDAWASGIARAQPGRWWNPKRYGTGWDLVYSDDRQSLKAFMYTFNGAGHSTWLATNMTRIDDSGDFWTANLREYTQDTAGTVSSAVVGRVMFRFFRDDPSRIAMRWKWDDAAALTPPAPQNYFEECLNDMTRLNPSYYTGVSGAPETVALYGDSKTVLEPAVSQVFSGYWADSNPTNVDDVPGVVMTIMQTSLGNDVGKFGEAAVRLMYNQRGTPPRKPIFVQAQRETLRPTLPLTEDTFNLYFHYGIGYPQRYAVTDCTPSTTPVVVNCNNNILVGTYTRTFLPAYNYRRASVVFTIDHTKLGSNGEVPGAPVPASPAYLLGVPPPGEPLASQTISKTVTRTTKLQDISVNRYVCAPPSNGTCDVWVSWAGDGSGKPWKRDLGSMTYDAAPLDTGDFGTASVALRTGDRVQFELWAGTPGAPGAILLDRTPEVRGVSVDSASQGAIQLPSAPQISNMEDLPPHDPTIGSVGGGADVSGGAATYTVPIQVPPGRNGMQPTVSLSYSSRGGNGIAGLGWSLAAGSSVQRCPQTIAQDGTSRGVRLDANDRLCLDGQRLMLAPGGGTYGNAGAEYRTEIESFAKITQSGASLGGSNVCFTVKQKSGHTLTYGCAPAGYLCSGGTLPRLQPGGQSSPKEQSWLLSRVEDTAGNTMDYCYKSIPDPNYMPGDAVSEMLLDRILYTGTTKAGLPLAATTSTSLRKIVFDYESRPSQGRADDRGSSWIAGGGVLQTQRLTDIRTYSPDSQYPVRRYILDYKDTAVSQLEHSYYSGRSLLRRVKECAYTDSGVEQCLKPTEFSWSDGSWEFTSRRMSVAGGTAPASAGAMALAPMPDVTWTDGVDSATAPAYQRKRALPIGDLDGDGTREMLVTRSWYDGQNWQFESQLSKVTADRETKGTVTLGNFSPEDAVDFDGDGIAEVFVDGKIYKWKRLRGAPICDGGATTCSASASSYFQEVGTNLPAGTYDFVQSVADFNGDGAPDVLIRMSVNGGCSLAGSGGKTGLKAVEPPSGFAPLCLFLNTRPGPIVAGTTVFSFAAPIQVDTFSSVTGESVQHVADLDGNGAADIVVADGNGTLRVWMGQIAGASMTFSAIAPGNMGLRSYTKNLRWMDVNADGLDDVVIADVPGGSSASCDASGCYALWVLQINKGGTFAPATYPAPPAGTLSPGLSIDRVSAQWRLRYYSKMIQTDVDSDGRPDLLYPAHFAARMCFGAKLTEGLCLTRPRETCSQGICDADVCAAPPPEDNGAFVAHPHTSVTCAADAYKSGLGEVDPSVYRYNAIRFVQTGPNSFRLQVDETPIVAGTSSLGNQRGRSDDYFGDGLADVVADAGCPLLPTANFPNNTCELSAGGTAGPGSATSYLDASQTIQLGQLVDPANVNLVINENLGDGVRSGSAPFLPDLLVTATNGLNDRATWVYYPLSSSAGRSSDFPLYQIDTGYVDARHFLFQSSMPVVATMGRSNVSAGGISGLPTTGFRSQRYSYSGAMYNSEGRGFQGFRSISSETLSGNDRAVRTVSTFHQKFPLTGRLQILETRLPAISGTPGRLSYETFDWRCNRNDRNADCPGQDGNPTATGAVHWPYLNTQAKRQYDLATALSGAPLVTIATTITTNADPMSTASGWDAYGNLTKQQVVVMDGLGSANGDKYNLASYTTTTTNTFDASTVGQWWLDKLASNTKTIKISYLPRGNGTPPDIDLSDKTVQTEYAWNGDRTLSWSRATEPASGTWLQTANSYPAISAGLPIGVTVTGSGIDTPRETRTSYSDDLYFPASVTAVLSAAAPSLNHTTTTTARASDGQPSSVVDPNGIKAVTTYDAFGRAIEHFSFRNDQTTFLAPPVHTRLARCNPCSGAEETMAVYYQATVADGSPSTRTWFDILGREVKRATRSFDGRWANVTTKYDSMGTVERTSAPFFTGETPLYMQFTYDHLARVLTKRVPTAELNTLQGDMLTTYTYAGLRTDITVKPVSGSCTIANLCVSMSRQSNALGQLMRTTDALGGITDYWMDALGKAAALRDANLNTTYASYNAFGHRLSSNDPNQGTWNFTYNALGELKTQTDARGVVTTVTQRDGIGRVLQQRREPTLGVPASLSDEKILDTWQYDPSGAKGQLALIKRQTALASTGGNPDGAAPAWQESYAYFADSVRLYTRTTTIAAAGPGPLVLTNEYQYDPYYGNLIGVTYPNPYTPGTQQRLTVWKRYNRYGMLGSLTDARLMTPLWTLWETDVNGKPAKEQFGYALYGYASYSRSTGQVREQYWRPFDRPTFTENLDKLTYGYDVLGNLTSQKREWLRYESASDSLFRLGLDRVGQSNELHGYDKLQRLISTDATLHAWNSNVSWDPFPAPKPHYDYQYDAVGNIKAKTYFANPYTYGNTSSTVGVNGHCGPNALASAESGDLENPLTRNYTCDANGNQISETGTGYGNETRNVVYDAANLPTRITHRNIWDANPPITNVTRFAYGADNARYYRREAVGALPNDETTGSEAFYGADGFEYEKPVNGDAVYRVELGPVVYTRKAGTSVSPPETAYQLRDRLGSIIAIADRWGHFNGSVSSQFTMEGSMRRSYDAFGSPRTVDLKHVNSPNSGLASQIPYLWLNPTSRHGFTDHEHLDRVRLIHMNGRVYDYRSGRFLSVDPFVKAPTNSQSLNPYSYILNNPLAGIDPSGYAPCKITDDPSCLEVGVNTVTDENGNKTTVIVGEKGDNIALTGAKFDVAQLKSISRFINLAWNPKNGADAWIKDGPNGGDPSGLGAISGSGKGCAGDGPLQCYSVTSNEEGKVTSFERTYKTEGRYGAVNGILNNIGRAMNLMAIHAFRRLDTREFMLAHNPTEGAFRDLLEAQQDKLAYIFGSTAAAKQFGDILAGAEQQMDWVAHSQGGAIFSESIRYNLNRGISDMSNIRVAFDSGANNKWVTNYYARRGGIGLIGKGYYDAPNDVVPQVVGLRAWARPDRMIWSILSFPSLFGPNSPHTYPIMDE